MTILLREIGMVLVTGLVCDEFTTGNTHGYVREKKETARDI